MVLCMQVVYVDDLKKRDAKIKKAKDDNKPFSHIKPTVYETPFDTKDDPPLVIEAVSTQQHCCVIQLSEHVCF